MLTAQRQGPLWNQRDHAESAPCVIGVYHVRRRASSHRTVECHHRHCGSVSFFSCMEGQRRRPRHCGYAWRDTATYLRRWLATLLPAQSRRGVTGRDATEGRASISVAPRLPTDEDSGGLAFGVDRVWSHLMPAAPDESICDCYAPAAAIQKRNNDECVAAWERGGQLLLELCNRRVVDPYR